MQKYQKSTDETTIWGRAGLDEDTLIKRCVSLDCSFNTADFWLDAKAQLQAKESSYIFKLHYGRNVAAIVKRKK